ncbi:hypothetical protein BJ170DRAFT_160834 [Xylariales sp. AK1849]|nr:hypothetical protein BJ170DRAFT_160834 [Xylariales sp. AK1849]
MSRGRNNEVRRHGEDATDVSKGVTPRITSNWAAHTAPQIISRDALSYVGTRRGSPLEGVGERRTYRHAHDSRTHAIKKDDNESFEKLPPISRHELDWDDSQPRSPTSEVQQHTSRPSATTISIPDRQSSRSRSNEPETPDRAVNREAEDETSARVPSAEEVEAARRILAAAGNSSHNSSRGARKKLPQSDRSATPPPIGRLRRPLDDELDDPDELVDPRPPTPETAILLQKEHPHQSLSRKFSLASIATHRSRMASFPYDQLLESRTPVLDQLQLGQESSLLPPMPKEKGRQRSRNGSPADASIPYGDGTRTFLTNGGSVSETEDRALPRNGSFNTGTTAKHRPLMAGRRVFSEESLSVSRHLAVDGRSIVSSGSSSRLPDFFSYAIFQMVLRNPTTAHQLLKFSKARLCGENIEFLGKVEEYQKSLSDLSDLMGTIHTSFISEQSPNQINVPGNLIRSVHAEMKSLVGTTVPGMEILFTDMRATIEELVFTDIYQRFVRYQITLSATLALSRDRYSYQGLGDCFCLTDPNKADNPILFASDGFVKVTGYGRPEIIPRNCRFLQGAQTDRVPIRRLKNGILECRETVELILNYKKNGDPFWNLLYVAPLLNENGKVAFFIGGQVNCSTTIHSKADVMRVLSVSGESDTDDEAKPVSTQSHSRPSALPSARKALLKAFGVRVDEPQAVLGNSGMESEVLDRMEGKTLAGQMQEFYTAYSKYLVVRADTFLVGFYSEGVADLLNPANNAGLIVGQEIFRFFKQNMVSKETDYRSRVRNAIRVGQPISVEIRLQTRRSARFRGDERFWAHWTPLKDENAASHWVVVMLAPTLT